MTVQFAGPISRTNEPANAAALLQLGPYYCCESISSLNPWQKIAARVEKPRRSDDVSHTWALKDASEIQSMQLV